jgi:hypothetical protein
MGYISAVFMVVFSYLVGLTVKYGQKTETGPDFRALVGLPPKRLRLRSSSSDDNSLGGLKSPDHLDVILFFGGLTSWERQDVQQLDFCYNFEELRVNSQQSFLCSIFSLSPKRVLAS